jgi:hypothetical protein
MAWGIGNTEKIPYSSKASLCVELYFNMIIQELQVHMMYLQSLQQQMRPDWNAGANMLAVTIVSFRSN